MDNIIIKNIKKSEFENLQNILFEQQCFWKNDKRFNKHICYTFVFRNYEYMCINNNIISIITEKESRYEEYEKYEIFNDVKTFFRIFKIKKLLT